MQQVYRWITRVVLASLGFTCQPGFVLAQTGTATNSLELPKPHIALVPGTRRYKGVEVQADGRYPGLFDVTVKDDGAAWTVTYSTDTPAGRVTDMSTLDKGTLVLRKELFTHPPKPGQPYKPVRIELLFSDHDIKGTKTTPSAGTEPVVVDSGGPVFADTAFDDTISCLPLREGYSASLRKWDVVKLVSQPVELRVVGSERVTVAAGTFDTYRVELAATGGRLIEETVWIAKDRRVPVRISRVSSGIVGGRITSTGELVTAPLRF